MDCSHWREVHSAGLDDEATPDELVALADHLAACASCRAHTARVEQQHRELRVREAVVVPDLHDAILSEVRARRIDRGLRRMALRAALAAVATLQLVLAIPQMLMLVRGEGAHELRHLGGWDLAFAIAIVVVVAQPWRARGLLPLATAVGAVMVATAIVDAVGGHPSGMPESQHALELLGLVLLWRLARIERLGWEPHGRGRRRVDRPATGAPGRPALRLVENREAHDGQRPTGTAGSA